MWSSEAVIIGDLDQEEEEETGAGRVLCGFGGIFKSLDLEQLGAKLDTRASDQGQL